jgi:hypothetical protein
VELSKAFEMKLEYYGKSDPIRVDQNGYICLTDLNKYFPKKRIRDWENLSSTKEFIDTVIKHLNSEESRSLKLITKKRGRYDGGTYAHQLIAFEFATWLSPEFKLEVFLRYQDGRQNKKDWNIRRILSAFNYKLMSNAVENADDPVKFYHYSNEAIMINKIVFGHHDKELRDTATIQELEQIATLESHNATMIEIGLGFQERKEKLKSLSETKQIKEK